MRRSRKSVCVPCNARRPRYLATALIVAERAYEMNSNVINTAEQMLQSANQVKS